MNKEFFKNLLIGPFFLLLYIIVSPLKWLLMQAFGYTLTLHTWICKKLNKTLNLDV